MAIPTVGKNGSLVPRYCKSPPSSLPFKWAEYEGFTVRQPDILESGSRLASWKRLLHLLFHWMNHLKKLGVTIPEATTKHFPCGPVLFMFLAGIPKPLKLQDYFLNTWRPLMFGNVCQWWQQKCDSPKKRATSNPAFITGESSPSY